MNSSPILQTITDDNSIENHTDFGNMIFDFSQANLHLINKYKQCGWLDGGCFALAHAFSQYFTQFGLDNTIVCCGRETWQDHAIVRLNHPELGVVFIDADGVATEEEIINKMILLEDCPNSIIQPYWRVFDDAKFVPKILKQLKKDQELTTYVYRNLFKPIQQLERQSDF